MLKVYYFLSGAATFRPSEGEIVIVSPNLDQKCCVKLKMHKNSFSQPGICLGPPVARESYDVPTAHACRLRREIPLPFPTPFMFSSFKKFSMGNNE